MTVEPTSAVGRSTVVPSGSSIVSRGASFDFSMARVGRSMTVTVASSSSSSDEPSSSTACTVTTSVSVAVMTASNSQV